MEESIAEGGDGILDGDKKVYISKGELNVIV